MTRNSFLIPTTRFNDTIGGPRYGISGAIPVGTGRLTKPFSPLISPDELGPSLPPNGTSLHI